MDVAELRAIYTATSADFDRVTDHVQRRLKETQAQAGGMTGASQAVANEAKKIETTLASRAPVKFLGIDVAGEKKAAAEVVATAKQTVAQVNQATSKFDPGSFWARQTGAAVESSKTVQAEVQKTTAGVERAWISSTERQAAIDARRVTSAQRATRAVVTDTATGAKLTQAELQKLTGAASKVVDAEAAKVKTGVSKILGDLQTLFLRNNFLFRQLGQRVAGDAGFAAVGVGKLAINFSQLATASGGAGAELSAATSAATSALGVFGPLGVAIGVAVVALAAVEVAAIAASAGLFLIAKSVADTEEHFDDLSRQTGLSTDNLQALDVATRQAGSTLDRLNNSVGQLQRKLIDASEGGTSRLSQGLIKLGIDLDDPNKALNQLIDILAKLPAGTVRTGAAMQIFGRGGRELSGTIDQLVTNVGSADGVLDRFKKQLQDAGVHINSDGTRKSAEFHDQLILLGAQFQSVARIIGEEALPSVLRVATQFSDWLGRNRVLVADWARSVEHAAEKVVELGVQLTKLAKLGPIVIPIIAVVQEVRGAVSAAGSAVTTTLGALPEGARSEVIPFLGSLGAAGGGPPSAVPIANLPPGVDRSGGETPQPLPGTPPSTSEADSVAKRIRDAFGQNGRGGGGRGRRGEDPAEIARRLAEISLRETLRSIDVEKTALQRSLDQNLIARDRYTQEAVNLELKRRDAAINGLKVELAEAERIRKPGQRAVRVAEINARIKEANQQAAIEIQRITDDSAGEQLRIGQNLAQSQLRIIEQQTQQVTARIREQADFRMVSEQQAARFEVNQIERVFAARRRVLEGELIAAGKNVETREQVRNRIAELETERVAALESFWRQAEERGRQAAEHVVQFAAQVRDAFAEAADVRLQAREMSLEPLRNSILTRHQLWDAELRFETERELDRHVQVVSGFQDEEKLAFIRIKNAEELAQVIRGIRARERSEEEFHQARLRQLATQAAEQRREELLRVADDISGIVTDIFDAIGKSSEEFWASLANTAKNFARQIRDELVKGLFQKVLTGQAEGSEGLLGMILNPLLGGGGRDAQLSNNTKATDANTAALNALTVQMGGVGAGNNLSGVLQFIPGLFGGARASGGPVQAGMVYQVHDNEFFRPDMSGQILNLNQAQNLLGSKDEVRLNVAVGQDAVNDMIEANSVTPKGRRATLVKAKYNRKVGKLLFA